MPYKLALLAGWDEPLLDMCNIGDAPFVFPTRAAARRAIVKVKGYSKLRYPDNPLDEYAIVPVHGE